MVCNWTRILKGWSNPSPQPITKAFVHTWHEKNPHGSKDKVLVEVSHSRLKWLFGQHYAAAAWVSPLQVPVMAWADWDPKLDPQTTTYIKYGMELRPDPTISCTQSEFSTSNAMLPCIWHKLKHNSGCVHECTHPVVYFLINWNLYYVNMVS